MSLICYFRRVSFSTHEVALRKKEKKNNETADVGDCPKATEPQISTAKVCRIISLNAQHVSSSVQAECPKPCGGHSHFLVHFVSACWLQKTLCLF